MKRVSTVLALAVGAFATLSSAAQIQGFVSGFAPGSVEEVRTDKGTNKITSYDSDFSWSLGAEFLAFPANYVMVGGGVGFLSMLQNGDKGIVIPSLPLWGTVGVIGPEQWVARPYFAVRVGYPIPLSTYWSWFRNPVDFVISGNLGVHLPYHMGVELNCSYLTMDKFYRAEDVNFRLNSLKIGGSITVRFDLFGGASSSDKKAEQPAAVAEPAAEDYSSSFGSSESSENTETSTYDDPYSAYGDPASEQPSEETASKEPAAEEPVAEEAASEEVASEEPAEETAEEAASEPAEEVAEEAPAEEPKAEPAPAPAAKPAAKKAPAKKAAKKTTKKTTKKAAKKTTKKSTKKTTKKKK